MAPLLAPVALVLLLVLLGHLPSVQRWAFDAAAQRVEDASGLTVATEEVRARLLTGRLELHGVTVSGPTGIVAAVGSLEAGWRWRELLGDPPWVDRLRVEDPFADLRNLPPTAPGEAAEAPTAVDPGELLRSFEIGRFELVGGAATAAGGGVTVAVDGVRVEASLREAILGVAAGATALAVEKDGRTLLLRDLVVEATADPEAVTIRRLEADGDVLSLSADGRVALAPGPEVALEVEVGADVPGVLGWWDPAQVPILDPRGRLQLAGTVGWSAEGGPRVDLSHTGPPVSAAGFEIAELEVGVDGERVTAVASGGGWGRVRAVVDPVARLQATLELDRLEVDRVLAWAAVDVPAELPRDLVASGRLEVETSLPPSLDAVSATADLVLRGSGASLRLDGRLDNGVGELRRLRAELGDARLEGSGRIAADREVALDLELTVPDPAGLERRAAPWLPATVRELAFGLAGGPLRVDARVSGLVSDPTVRAEMAWEAPVARGVRLERLEAGLEADPGAPLRWRLAAAPSAGAVVTASGATGLDGLATTAEWAFELPSLAAVAALGPAELQVAGAASGAGDATWTPSGWSVEGRIDSRGLEWGGWRVDRAVVDFAADPERVELASVDVELYGGELDASGVVGLTDAEAPLAVALDVAGIDLAELPVALPSGLGGALTARLEAAGTLGRPTATLALDWSGDPAGVTRRLEIDASLADGVMTFSVPAAETAAGTLSAGGRVPLGDLPLPGWVWPEAPAEPVRISLAAADLRSEPLLAALGRPAMPVQMISDLSAEVRWDLADPAARFAEIRLEGLQLENAVETVRAAGPVLLRVDGDRAVVEPARLAGPRTSITVDGSYRFSTGDVHGSAEAVISPEMARLAPVPLQMREPLRLVAEIDGALDDLSGRLELTHPKGRIVMRDPALAIEDLVVRAELDDGAIWVEDGSATVNRGTVELAGGWDPASGQGIVMALDEVVFLLPYDILTTWSGNLALEPDPELMLRVVGDLVLEGGVWDRSLDIAGIAFGPAGVAPPADDPLWEVGLELDIRGRGGLAVDNNLGDFEVNWGLLEIRGTAAQPVLLGDIRVAPGGRLVLAGREIEVRRGTISFTGSPSVDPVVEIVPAQDVAVFGDGEGGGVDTTMVARQGVARGLGAVLGLENETLRPAEIAIETDTDTTTSFTAGQRLTRNVALFLTTDLSDVQDRTTMLQLWNLRQLPGLAVQAWERTATENSGVNVVQRFRWGGSATADDRPVIHRIRLEGEWPVWAWWFKRKLGIHRGEPYEPFVAFAAGLRLERELAARGWQLARVELETTGSERSPTLEYTVDPGPRTELEFVGHEPPGHIAREATALYQPPPLEGASFAAITELLERHYRSEGHPYADITVERSGEAVRVAVERGRKLDYEGPVVEGVGAEAAAAVRAVLGSPSELVLLLEEPDRGGQIVGRILQNLGYRQASVVRVWAERVEEDLSRVHMEVDPGPRAEIQQLRVEGDDPLGAVAGQEALREGQPLDRTPIERAADRVERRYRDAGWIDAEVRVRYEGGEGGSWDVVVEIAPGVPRTVAGFDFKGRRHVSRSALASGLELDVGDPLRLDLLDRSMIEIATFAPIERLGMVTRPAGPGSTVVEFEVEERPRWIVELGAGWSSDFGNEWRFGVRDGGLLGRGGSLSLRGRWREEEQLALLYAELPPLPGRRISFGSAVRWERADSPDNPDSLRDEELSLTLETTFDLRRGRGIRPYYRLSETTTSLKEPDQLLDPFFPQTNVESILGLQLYRDTLDNPFDPRSGSYLALDTNWNSPELGSDLNDTRSLVTGSLVLTNASTWTWAQSLRLGVAEGLGGANLTPGRKFFAGGQASIRGFEKDLVGPVTIGFDGGINPDGGGALLVLNEELRIPVWGSLRLAVFADVGQVWETWSDADRELAVGAGIGIRYATPIGPLWADVAWPVANRGASEPGARFYFGIGRPF